MDGPTTGSGGSRASAAGRTDLESELREPEAAIADRLEHLRRRGRQLRERSATRGSTPAEASAAREWVVQAREHAERGHERSAELLERSASQHEQTAAASAEHALPGRAAAHRDAAEQDRDAAAADVRAAADE